MRILMASRGVLPLRTAAGGAELVAFQLARSLALDGHEVVLLEDVEENASPTDGLTIQPIGSGFVRLLGRLPGGFFRWILQHLAGNVVVARRVRRLLAVDPDYDVVHVHGALAAVLLARRVRVPLVYTEHDATPWSCRYRRWWERGIRKAVYTVVNGAAFRRASLVVTIFELLREEVALRWNVPPERLATVVNGTDVDIFRPDRPGVSRVRQDTGFDRYCVFVGRLTPRKAPDLLLRALVEAPDVMCAFVGDGPMWRKLEALVDELGVRDRVAFLGNVPPAELGRIYGDADFLVLPSVSEGTPLVILEAMACGTPVLATRVAGTPNLVRDWETGFVVKPGDVGQLAMGMRFLHGDDALRARMGEAARERIIEAFPWPMVARRYAALYADLVGERQLHLEDMPEALVALHA